MTNSNFTTSPMRLLIAEPDCRRRVAVEKTLAILGYFRVCPTKTFHELTALTHYSPDLYDRFDLLIINAELISDAGLDALDFCVDNSRLRHVLIYNSKAASDAPKTLSELPHHQVRLVETISYDELVDFLKLIDKKHNVKKSKVTSIAFPKAHTALVRTCKLTAKQRTVSNGI